MKLKRHAGLVGSLMARVSNRANPDGTDITDAQRLDIKAAITRCVEAFDGSQCNVGDWCWCIHHELLLEKLEEDIERRFFFIVTWKKVEEITPRFNNLRPVSNPKLIPAYVMSPGHFLGHLDAQAKFWKTRDCRRLFKKDVPLGTWNGQSIFTGQTETTIAGHSV